MPHDHRSIARTASTARRRIAVGLTVCAWLVAVDANARGGRRRLARTTTSRAEGVSRPAVVARGTRRSSGGLVRFVTDKRAYLDRGSRDGLKEKQTLQIIRGGRPAGTCAVDTLADHQATCVGGRPRQGDSFRLASRKSDDKQPQAATPVPVLPPLVDRGTLAARAEAVADAPYEKVEFGGVRAFAAHSRGLISPSVTIWHTQTDARGDYTQEQLDGAIEVSELGGTGMRFDAAFTAMRWGTRATLGRFQPSAQTQFYVWDAELSKRRPDAHTVFAVGRIWPWHTPGLTLLDGVQVGRRNHAQTVEGGVYAGLIPWSLNVGPSVGAWATGAYGALVQPGSNKRIFRLAREEARVGIWHGPNAGTVTEADVLAQVWLGSANLGAGGRVRLAPAVSSQPVLERAYFDLGSRPTLRLGGGLHVRYFGASLPGDAVLLRAETATVKGSIHAIADAHWELRGWLGLSGFAGAHQDGDSGRGQISAAAELRLPRVLGDVGGLALGAEAQEGWLLSRIGYGQIVARVKDRVRILARGSFTASQFRTPTVAWNAHEIGGYLHVESATASWLRLRAWSLLRVPVFVLGEPSTELTLGIVAGLSATGAF